MSEIPLGVGFLLEDLQSPRAGAPPDQGPHAADDAVQGTLVAVMTHPLPRERPAAAPVAADCAVERLIEPAVRV